MTGWCPGAKPGQPPQGEPEAGSWLGALVSVVPDSLRFGALAGSPNHLKGAGAVGRFCL